VPQTANAPDAGSLDTPISVENLKDPPTRAASGAAAKEWQTFAPLVWSNWKQFRRGQENFEAGAYFEQLTYKVKIRPLDGLTMAMRLVDGVRTFDITNIDDRGARGFFILEVKEGKSKGS
jgi:head-tail adaptor